MYVYIYIYVIICHLKWLLKWLSLPRPSPSAPAGRCSFPCQPDQKVVAQSFARSVLAATLHLIRSWTSLQRMEHGDNRCH